MNKLIINITFLVFLIFLSDCFSRDSNFVNHSDSALITYECNPCETGNPVFNKLFAFPFLLSIKDTIESPIEVYKNRNTNFKSERNFWKIGIAGGLTLLGTYSTFRLREISNEAYNNYKMTNDEYQYDKSKKYEVYFYVTLALTQGAFAALMYLLFFD
ncbi:MAG: hypothetical protein JW917_10090 [Ignavibacteria bacterium]|nr:hypothetical protein [Ignavibacteria bacterium]